MQLLFLALCWHMFHLSSFLTLWIDGSAFIVYDSTIQETKGCHKCVYIRKS
jgi:hypothetical protein